MRVFLQLVRVLDHVYVGIKTRRAVGYGRNDEKLFVEFLEEFQLVAGRHNDAFLRKLAHQVNARIANLLQPVVSAVNPIKRGPTVIVPFQAVQELHHGHVFVV